MTKSVKRKNIQRKHKTRKNRRDIDVLSNKSLETVISETSTNKVYKYYNNMLLNYLKTPYQKDTIHLPQNDYYSFINEKWFKYLKINKSLKYLTKVDDFRVVQFNVYNKLEKIIQDYIKDNANTHIGNELKNFYSSAIKFNSHIASKNHIREITKYVDTLRQNKNNLWKLLAFINKNETTNDMGPFSWKYYPDKKNKDQFCSYINPHTFAFFDLKYYINNTNKQEEYIRDYKKAFFTYLKNLFAFVGDKTLVPEDVFNVEQELFTAMASSECLTIKEDDSFYNKVYAEDALTKYGFNWKEYSKELGFTNTPSFFVTPSLNYLKCCTQLLVDKWDSEEWRSYWIWIISRFVARLTNKVRNFYYIFYGKTTQGMEQIVPLRIYSIMYTAFAFNSLLNNKYIENNYNERDITFCKNMANNIREIFKNIISRNKWLQPKTKKYAIFKLNKLIMNIEPTKLTTNDPLLNYNPNDFIGNLEKLLEWRTTQFVQNNVPVIKNLMYFDFTQYPPAILSQPSFLVNARYSLDENAMYIPMAYIQKPFIDLDERGIEYNLAYMGFTIAHELSHALDDLGSQYDYKGELKNWWTDKDKRKYKQIQNDIIIQYNKFASYDKIQMDASTTIGEDIADISGLTICEEYLQNVHVKDKNIPVINRQSYADLYIYFTYQLRQHIKRKSVQYELIKNPHPLDKYRANVPLSRSEIFRTLYNVQPEDHMYWTNKTNIW
jgi:putative endopeptidase